MSRQSQSGGDYSTNVQGAGPVTIVQAGLSPEEAAKLALSLVQSEFEHLKDEAVNTAYARAEEMVQERLLPRLMALNPAGVETFADPDVQYALMAAQRTYARTGDKDVADVLVDILVDRTKETERTIRQLALTESLDVAAKLTADQFAALSIIWLIRYTRSLTVANQQTLQIYIDTHLAPHVSHLRSGRSTFQHLEYAGCGAVSMGEVQLEAVFRNAYAGVFSLGFDNEEFSAAFGNQPPARIDEVLMPCLNEAGRQQVDALDEDAVRQRAAELHFTDEETLKLVSLFNQSLMPYEQVRQFLEETHPAMTQLFAVWTDSLIKNMTLTTVGIVIAHANCRRIMGQSPADLAIWID